MGNGESSHPKHVARLQQCFVHGTEGQLRLIMPVKEEYEDETERSHGRVNQKEAASKEFKDADREAFQHKDAALVSASAFKQISAERQLAAIVDDDARSAPSGPQPTQRCRNTYLARPLRPLRLRPLTCLRW